MKPTSFKEYLAKSLIVRANWLTKELQELERLRAWEKRSKCYNCGELVSRNKAVSCSFCDNTNCCNESCPMFYGYDGNNDAICNVCLTKHCAICFKTNKLTQCDMYCKGWFCDDCTNDDVCSCGYTEQNDSDDSELVKLAKLLN